MALFWSTIVLTVQLKIKWPLSFSNCCQNCHSPPDALTSNCSPLVLLPLLSLSPKSFWTRDMLLWSLAKLQKGKGKINTASKQSLCFSEYDICPVFTSGKNNKDTYASNGNRMNDNRETFQVWLVKGNDFIVIVPIWWHQKQV